MQELRWLDATAQAELVRTGQLRPVDLVDAALDRLDADAELSTTPIRLDERARRGATAGGSFPGVPILLKDAGQELAGTPHWVGTRALQRLGHRSRRTTPLAARLERSGFAVVGRGAVPELATGITTEPPTGPPTRNPWDPSRTVGGSSGGSAAAVAAGTVPLAHGADSTGSLRYPAACCAVLTLKATAGTVPSLLPAGQHDPDGVHVDGVLARSVRDLRAVLRLVAAPAPAPPPPAPATVGVPTRMPFDLPLDPAVERSLSGAAAQLSAEGYRLVPVDPAPLERFAMVLGAAVPVLVEHSRAAAVTWIEDRLGRPATGEDLSPEVLDAAARGRRRPPAELHRARHDVRAAAEEVAAWTDASDALLLPVLGAPPWPIGSAPPDTRLGGISCSLASFTGQPAVVVPLVDVDIGLPVGVQLVGRHGHDGPLLDVLERLAPVAPRPPERYPR